MNGRKETVFHENSSMIVRQRGRYRPERRHEVAGTNRKTDGYDPAFFRKDKRDAEKETRFREITTGKPHEELPGIGRTPRDRKEIVERNKVIYS